MTSNIFQSNCWLSFFVYLLLIVAFCHGFNSTDNLELPSSLENLNETSNSFEFFLLNQTDSCPFDTITNCFYHMPMVIEEFEHFKRDSVDSVDRNVNYLNGNLSKAIECTEKYFPSVCNAADPLLETVNQWMWIIMDTLNFATKSEPLIMNTLANLTNCWTFEAFAGCLQNQSKIESLKDWLLIPFVKENCEIMDYVFASCNEQISITASTKPKCTPLEEHLTSLSITKLLHHFLSKSACRIFLDFETGPINVDLKELAKKDEANSTEQQIGSRMVSNRQTAIHLSFFSLLPVWLYILLSFV